MARPGTGARRRARRFGLRAERVCRWRLRICGWRIVARNWRGPTGEIDIVARRGAKLAFVEVKARGRGAAGAPDAGQRRRIVRTAQLFLARNPRLGALSARFDVMTVAPWPNIRSLWPAHIADAWRPAAARRSA